MKIILFSAIVIAMVVLVIPNIYAQEQVPAWVKNTAGWWATNAISETEFVNAIEFLIENNIITLENDISSLLLTWDKIVDDAKYANQGSLLIRDQHYENPHNLSVHFNTHSESFYDVTTFDLLHSGISIFEITGDEKYLDQARNVADVIEQHLLLDGQVHGLSLIHI